MRKTAILFLFPAFAAMFSCDDSNDREAFLPARVGPSGEVLVVLKKADQKDTLLQTIDRTFGQAFPMLPQWEPEFDVNMIDVELFDRFWRPHRNVLFIDIADRVDTKEPSLVILKNKYSRGQIYMELKARTVELAAAELENRALEIASILSAEETKRYVSLIQADRNAAVDAELQEKYGVSLQLPRDARVMVREKEFVLIDRQLTRLQGGDNHDVKEGFMVYFYPYTSETQFSPQYLINKRDSLLRVYVHGTPPNSYMATELRMFPRYEEINFNDAFAAEMRGLWRMEGDWMGGPFISLTMYDELNKRMVTVDGYAYAPNFDKREYLREVEAIVKSLKLVPIGTKPTA